MSNPFDPKQLEERARALSEKVISGISNTMQAASGQQKQTDNSSDTSRGFSSQIESMRTELQGLIEIQIQQFLQKMDVVTREDFEVQRTMLKQAMHRIDALEQTIQSLSARMDALESSDQATATSSTKSNAAPEAAPVAHPKTNDGLDVPRQDIYP